MIKESANLKKMLKWSDGGVQRPEILFFGLFIVHYSKN
jgi:hypothetical protein